MEIKLSPRERIALRKYAYRERRAVADQAAVIIQRELERCGLLVAEPAGHE